MTREPVVFRSQDPSVLSAYDEWLLAEKRFVRQSKSFARAVEPARKRLPVMASSFGIYDVMGVSHDADWPVPDGWRTQRGKFTGETYLTPRLTTRVGKQLKQQMDKLRLANLRDSLDGMPGVVFQGGFWTRPAVELHTADGTRWVYVVWNIDPRTADTGFNPRDRQSVDESVWEPVRLSAYYAIREAAEGDAA